VEHKRTLFFYHHTAFKLNSLWHVGYLLDGHLLDGYLLDGYLLDGYLLDGFYGFLVCSRVHLLLHNPARCPDSTKPPQLLG
jgi:hypothetical protein